MCGTVLASCNTLGYSLHVHGCWRSEGEEVLPDTISRPSNSHYKPWRRRGGGRGGRREGESKGSFGGGAVARAASDHPFPSLITLDSGTAAAWSSRRTAHTFAYSRILLGGYAIFRGQRHFFPCVDPWRPSPAVWPLNNAGAGAAAAAARRSPIQLREEGAEAFPRCRRHHISTLSHYLGNEEQNKKKRFKELQRKGNQRTVRMLLQNHIVYALGIVT